MQARELKARIDAAFPEEADAKAQQAVCTAFRILRNFLYDNVTQQKGFGGMIFGILFPKTAAGLKEVVRLLDEYLASNCGA